MKVYAVEEQYEGVYGIFATLDDALAEIRKFEETINKPVLYVVEYEIGKAGLGRLLVSTID